METQKSKVSQWWGNPQIWQGTPVIFNRTHHHGRKTLCGCTWIVASKNRIPMMLQWFFYIFYIIYDLEIVARTLVSLRRFMDGRGVSVDVSSTTCSRRHPKAGWSLGWHGGTDQCMRASPPRRRSGRRRPHNHRSPFRCPSSAREEANMGMKPQLAIFDS